MDPDETLEQIRRNLLVIDTETDGLLVRSAHEDLAELIDGLDCWLSRGGFPPKAWRYSARSEA